MEINKANEKEKPETDNPLTLHAQIHTKYKEILFKKQKTKTKKQIKQYAIFFLISYKE